MLMQLKNGTWISAAHVTGLHVDSYGASAKLSIRLAGETDGVIGLLFDSEPEARKARDALAQEINRILIEPRR